MRLNDERASFRRVGGGCPSCRGASARVLGAGVGLSGAGKDRQPVSVRCEVQPVEGQADIDGQRYTELGDLDDDWGQPGVDENVARLTRWLAHGSVSPTSTTLATHGPHDQGGVGLTRSATLQTARSRSAPEAHGRARPRTWVESGATPGRWRPLPIPRMTSTTATGSGWARTSIPSASTSRQ